MLIELDPVDRITADAVGPPGSRAFYLQGRQGERLVTLLLEKQQVQLLAASVVEILARVGKETGQGPTDEEMGLDEPVVPEWRAGRLSIGYHDERDLLMLEVEEFVPEDDDEDDQDMNDEEDEDDQDMDEGEDLGPTEDVLSSQTEGDLAAGSPLSSADLPGAGDLGRVRFWASREQMLSLARHGASVCAAGRPLCPLCRNPMDPEGHQCPALNGHRTQDGG